MNRHKKLVSGKPRQGKNFCNFSKSGNGHREEKRKGMFPAIFRRDWSLSNVTKVEEEKNEEVPTADLTTAGTDEEPVSPPDH